MPQPDLAPLAQRMDARFDELVERLVEQLPSTGPFYAGLPPEARRVAAINLYKVLRDSVEEGGIERFAQAMTQTGRARIAQGGSPDDLRAATDLVRQMNLSLVDDLAHIDPGAAIPAFSWLDRLASVSLGVFNSLAQEVLVRQAEELNILMVLSERIEHAGRLAEIVEALFEQLPHLGVDRAVVALPADDGLSQYEIIGAFDRDERAPRPPPAARFSPEVLLKAATADAVCLPLNTADLTAGLREQLAPAGIETLVIVPMHGQRGIYGLLILGYRQAHTTDEEEQRFLASLARLLRSRMSNLRLIESLQRSNEEQQHMLGLLRELSTPLVPVMEGILVMPLIGELDDRRAGQVMERLLEGVTRAAADIVIIDITGVPLVDTNIANALVQVARAVRLLGAEALLVGITPEVAQTLVGLGADLRELVTRGDLQSGIAYALRRRGFHIARADGTLESRDEVY
jgi:anti-anti-sigma regulatory factor